jgi:hypothetical protein
MQSMINFYNYINKYLYGYNLLCLSFNDIVNSNNPDNCIIISGAGNYIKELNLNRLSVKYLEDLYNTYLYYGTSKNCFL